MKRKLALLIVCIFAFSTLSFAKTVKEHYPNGSIRSVVHYNAQGQKHGHFTTYWMNGKVMEQGTYKNGRIQNPVKKYSIDGELLNY
ncbi:MAG: hypothetical protein HQL15_05750 [Candidatus Omnitrophica bacterium]|nr:hypothetical protein [Candidatus Omnitrophota bacterium]